MGLEICSPCDTKKQENLGEILNQQGIEQFDFDDIQSYNVAIDLFRKGAEKGWEKSRSNLSVVLNLLGVRYYNGDNVEFSLEKAEECFKESAELGNDSAKKNLATLYIQYGEMYSNGKRLKVNQELAEKYFKKAVEYDAEKGKTKLVKFYINSYFNFRRGVAGYKKDPVLSDQCIKKAKALDSNMVKEFGIDYYNRAEKLLSQGVTRENYHKINGYLKRASHLTDINLTDTLIDFYKTVAEYSKKGKNGFSKDKDRSNRYYGKAAALGDPEAKRKYKD